MAEAPGPVSDEQLDELKLRVVRESHESHE
jgi:hypothetical protein